MALLACEGISHFLYYLDDFSMPPELREITPWVQDYWELGFPVAPDKIVGPSTTLTFLRDELNLGMMVLRLPKPKLKCLKA